MPQPIISESRIILFAALIQFVHIVDFMMVMPLGPDFARALHIPAHQIGIIGGSYTFAAAISGLAAGFFLDNFARKQALLLFLGLLSCATLAGAFAVDTTTMVLARLMAGLCGGPLVALGNALIADIVPPERRGAAIGKAMGAFSAASVLGVPFGLQLAQWFSWHAPFIAVAVIGAVTTLAAWRFLPFYPPFRAAEPLQKRIVDMTHLLRDTLSLTAFAVMTVSMLSAFLIIPNISAHFQLNLHYPRAQLGLLYMLGGALSFFTTRLAGTWVDRTSGTRVVSIATLLFVAGLLAGYVFYPQLVPVYIPALAVFVVQMVALTMRNICAQTVTSKIPPPALRGGYMALQGAITNLAGAVGAFVSSLILTETETQLLHVPAIAALSLSLSLLLPLLFIRLERQLRARPQAVH